MGKTYIGGMKTVAPKDSQFARACVVVNLAEFQAFAAECIANGRSSDAKDSEKNVILKKDGTPSQALWFDLKESKAGDLYFEMWYPDAAPAPKPVAAPAPEPVDDDLPF